MRFGRVGTALLLLTVPLWLPVMAFGVGAVYGAKWAAGQLRLVPLAIRTVVYGA